MGPEKDDQHGKVIATASATPIRDFWDAEPVALIEALRATAEKTLLMAVLFGVPLTGEQVAGVIGVLGSIFGVLMIVVRNKVSPAASNLPTSEPEPPLPKESLKP